MNVNLMTTMNKHTLTYMTMRQHIYNYQLIRHKHIVSHKFLEAKGVFWERRRTNFVTQLLTLQHISEIHGDSCQLLKIVFVDFVDFREEEPFQVCPAKCLQLIRREHVYTKLLNHESNPLTLSDAALDSPEK